MGSTSFTGVRLSGAAVAVTNGIPLFAAVMLQDWSASLDALTVPADLIEAFSNSGYSLSSSSSVTVVQQSAQWTLLQDPVNQSPGVVELVGFSLFVSDSSLSVYGSSISVNEVQTGGYTINLILPVEPSALALSQLDPTTRCPIN